MNNEIKYIFGMIVIAICFILQMLFGEIHTCILGFGTGIGMILVYKAVKEMSEEDFYE